MTFRDDRQRAAVCRALCALAGRPDVWGPLGPTEAAVDLAVAPDLSPGQHVLVVWAWDVWDGTGGALVTDAIAHLDAPRLHAVASLLTALAAARHTNSAKPIDAWLSRYQPPTVRLARIRSESVITTSLRPPRGITTDTTTNLGE